MGMPISNYTVLKALGSDRGQSRGRSRRSSNRSSFTQELSYDMRSSERFNFLDDSSSGSQPYEIQAARAALSPFNLFAFIIHDPERHSDFDHRIRNRFETLDYATGDKLLFFALVDPSKEWLERAVDRRYYEYLRSRETQELLNPANTIESRDKGIAAVSLAGSLGIPDDELPCLVMTNDFTSKDVYWAKTCPNEVVEQLTILGYEARRSGHINLENLKHQIDLCGGSGIESLESSLAKALSDVLSFIVAGSPESRNDKNQALEQAQNTLRELYGTLANLKENFAESNTDELDRLYTKIGLSLANFNPQTNLNSTDFISIDEAYLEYDSIVMLKTAHRVLDLFRTPGVLDQLNRRIDYTPGVICLTKVFEREINLSAVHWIRQQLDITLPDYFDKYQEDRKAIRRSGKREIDFNRQKGRSNRWLPPGIGESEIIYRSMIKGSSMSTNKLTAAQQDDLLLRNWNKIRNIRNRATHTELMPGTSVSEVERALDQLSTAGVFGLLHEMKKDYRT